MSVALLAVGLSATGCSSGAVTDGSVAGVRIGSDQGFVSGDGTSLYRPPAERVAAPDLRGPSLEGKDIVLSDYRGKVVVLNVWASWCVPCRDEAPALRAVAENYADRGVTFLGINTRDSIPPAQAFERQFEIGYPSLFDPVGELQLLFRNTITAQAVPSTLIVDADGRIAARVIGPVTRVSLSELLDRVLGVRPASGSPATSSPDPSSPTPGTP